MLHATYQHIQIKKKSVRDKPKTSHEVIETTPPVSWARMSEGYSGPSSSSRYAILFCRDMEFSLGHETEAQRHRQRPRVEGLKEIIR
jgi:hypothetical protein